MKSSYYDKRSNRWIVREKVEGKWKYAASYKTEGEALQHTTAQSSDITANSTAQAQYKVFNPVEMKEEEKNAVWSMVGKLVDIAPRYRLIEDIKIAKAQDSKRYDAKRKIEGLGTIELILRIRE